MLFASPSLRSRILLFGLPIAIFFTAGSPGLSLGDEAVAIQMATDPALSPDGKILAFRWANEIWTVPTTGGDATRLTNHPAVDSQPKFSPDGSKIAFVSDRSGSNQIHVMDARGGVPIQKTFHTEGYSIADWFPDGKSVLAIGQRDHYWRGGQRLLKVSLEERKADQVLLDDTAIFASLSHDGKRVLFTREGERWWRKGYHGERASQIWNLDLESKKTTELLHEGVECMWPLWMPNDTGFYFTKGDESGFDLWRYRFPKEEGKSPKQKQIAGFDEDSIVKPTLSRDGSTLVFRHLFDLYSVIPQQDDAPKKIEIRINTDTGLRDDKLFASLSKADAVAFSDDGLDIALAAGGDLWVMDTELREPIRATATDAIEGSPLFAMDAKTLYFTRAERGQVDIWKAEPKQPDRFWWQQSAFVETRLTNTPASESNLQFTPDGKKLLFQAGRGDLHAMDLMSKEVVTLLQGFSDVDYSISPDSKWIAYATQDNDFNSEIFVMPLDKSSAPVNVSRHPDNDRNPVFSADGKLLAFTGRRFAEESDVFYVYLQEELDEKTSRDRRLEKALEAMNKRKANDPKPTEGKSDDANPDGKNGPAAVSKEGKRTKEEGESKEFRIDLDKIHERIRRINLPDTSEGNLLFSPDGKKLAFSASVENKQGWYSVEFPDKLQPKLMSSTTLASARWTKASNAILGHNRGVPAKLEGGEKLTDFTFTVRQERSRSGRLREGFNVAWQTMGELWYDRAMGNKNWDEIRRKYERAAGQAYDESGLAEIVELMLGELNGSHLGFTPGTGLSEPGAEGESAEKSPIVTAHLGVRFEEGFQGPGLRIRDVLPGGPGDLETSKLKAGDVITMVDGQKVDPSMDLSLVLNGFVDRNIDLTVDRKRAQDAVETLSIQLRPITYRQARTLLYDQWMEHNRQMVEKLSNGKLGYLHIRAMDAGSFLEFERQLYNVGYGRDGLVIDVRDNGGGSTTDHLLTALTQPRHAITVPRNGGEGYPHDRMIYATWSKPIVVLCNQNSYSNAEIFSHAIKVLKRGKVVGVQTAGGVVSTGVARVTDVGVLRAPFRGWFSIESGLDMELNGALPDIVVWPLPGELPAGTDKQLEKGVEVLLEEVAAVKPLPKPKYATESSKVPTE
ncbi:hypothetical protein VN12_04460 [Pirellula sp. SH-Sr6A]|nr:hypothetical protein VN12_04460 [Pirellula sp. SH-Sr6A]